MTITKNQEINAAIREVQIAEAQFNNADNEFIDSAIHRLNHALEYLNIIIKLSRV